MSTENLISPRSVPPVNIKRCLVSNALEQQIFAGNTTVNFSQVDEDPDANYSAGVWTSDKLALYNIQASLQIDAITTYGASGVLNPQLVYDDTFTPVVISHSPKFFTGTSSSQTEYVFDIDYIVPIGHEIYLRVGPLSGNGIRIRPFPVRTFMSITEVGPQ